MDGYPRISVVICALNEEGSLPQVLCKMPNWVNEVILVDGHSKDRTVAVAKKLRPDIKVLYQLNRGKGDALKYGLTYASGDIVVTLDADGATDPDEMYKFIEALQNGYDFAKGTRLAKGRPAGMPYMRFFGNKVLAVTASLLVGIRYTDVCSGYNAFWKGCFPKVELENDGFEMEQELNVKIAKFGFKVVEVPHSHKVRTSGESKVNDVRQGVKDLLIILFDGLKRYDA
jgi:glycosyltransferase involved in cell wall biosynthesis